MQKDLMGRLGRVTLLGAGKMGGAIIAGLVALDDADPTAICALEHTQERADFLMGTYGIRATTDQGSAFPADTVIVAVKPQVAPDLLRQIAATQPLDGTLVISIAAGLTTQTLQGLLPDGVSVVRVMPNTPLMVGAGTTTVSGGSSSTEQQVRLVCDLFDAIGTAVMVDEADQDACCALNGSGPAYFARAITAMAHAGQRLGLSLEVATELALSTMHGTAKLLIEGDMRSEELVEAVSSPGGTTVAALEAMEGAGFSDALEAGVEAAYRRSIELG